MTRGKLLRWRVVEGAELPENGMDPICDVAPTGLTSAAAGGGLLVADGAYERGVALAAAQRLRSPLVLKRIDDALNHRHFPLSVIQE